MVSLHRARLRPNTMRGFTLVELMVTIAIMVFLLLVALPLTLGWVHSIQISKSKDLLLEGLGQARSFALRNPYHVQASASQLRPAVARLELDNDTLTVVVNCSADSHCASTGGQAVWSTDLSRGAGVAIAFGGQRKATATLDHTGMLSAPIPYTITKGTAIEQETLR